MFVVRSITSQDAEAFVNIAFEAGIGITSMPKNRQALLERVALAEESFNKTVDAPSNENYLFILEDLASGIVGGTSGIIANTGIDEPLYFYRREMLYPKTSEGKDLRPISILRVVHYYDAPSEICSLYLAPQFRKGGLGRLLSLSRFLFIACFPERFDKMIFAEMRGRIENNQLAAFWEGVGKYFANVEFTTLMHLRDEGKFDMSQVLPTLPIYIPLLPSDIQKAIGSVHHDTRPALNMLIQEGFKQTEEIDVCDGGPKIEAETSKIRSIQSSEKAKVLEIAYYPIPTSKYIICNNHLDFRACYGEILRLEKGICLSAEVAEALKVKINDVVRFVASTWEDPESIKENI